MTVPVPVGIDDVPDGRLGYARWAVVFGMFLVTSTVVGVALYGFIIVAQAMAIERGWTSTQAGSLVSAMWLSAPLALVFGPISKRFGAWKFLIGGLLLEAVAFLLLGSAEAFWQVYLLRVAMGAAKVCCIVTIPVIISAWFEERFSLAIALAWCGGAFGGMVAAPAAELLIDAQDWRSAVRALAAAIAAVASVVAAIGWRARRASTNACAHEDKSDFTRPRLGFREAAAAIQPSTAATMAFAIAMSGIAFLAFAFETPKLLVSAGFSPTVAASVLGLNAAGALIGSATAGWTLDRYPLHRTTVATALALAAGLCAFAIVTRFPAPAVAVAVFGSVAFGCGLGACEVLWITLTKRQFGASLFVVTYGGWSFSYQLGYALAGPIAGAISERIDHLQFLIVIGLFCIPPIAFGLWRPGARSDGENIT
jgi:MFS family permease